MTKGWLIYNKEDLEKNRAFAKMLVNWGKVYDLELQIMLREQLNLGIEKNKLSITREGEKIPYPKFVINRTRDSFIAKHFELMGIKVFNTAVVTQICNDKASTHQYISSLGIPMMDSLFFNKKDMRVEVCSYQYPLVIKSLGGHGGEEVFKAENKAAAKKVIGDMPQAKLLIQPMCSQPGVDIRVFIVGNKILAAMKRISKTDFRSNYSLGGEVIPYHLTLDQEEMVKNILKALPMAFAGIDFILDEKDNFLFNEIEDVVGCRMLYTMTNLDPAKLYMEHIGMTLK